MRQGSILWSLMAVMRVIAFVLVLAGLWLPAGPARAQSGSDKATAEQLFQAGRALVREGDYNAACPKFEASFALDPAVGTQLNLARCLEKLGKLASAWGHYREAADRARQSSQGARAKAARRFADDLEPRLPTLIIRVPEEVRVEGLQVTRGESVVNSGAFNTPVFVDPGAVDIIATAPGHKRFYTRVQARLRKRTTVEIPALERMSDADNILASNRNADGSLGADGLRDQEGTADARSLKWQAWASTGVGAFAMIGGGVSIISARGIYDGAFDDELCRRDTRECSAAGQAETDRARSRSLVGSLLVVTGAALVATGVTLFLLEPEPDPDPERDGEAGLAPRIQPHIGPDGIGVSLQARF